MPPYDVEGLRSVIATGKRFVLTTHLNPDGDGLGSECALALYLESQGKQVRIINPGPTPWNYEFLGCIHPMSGFDPVKDAEAFQAADVIVVLDTNHLPRLGAIEPRLRQSRARKVCIDHHLEPEQFADVAILDEDTAATGQMLFEILSALSPRFLTPAIATSLYAAIMTDTGSFRFPKTTGRVHRIVADLLEAGADPSGIYQEVFERGSIQRMKLLGEILSGMRTTSEGRVVSMVVTREMFARTGTTEADLDAFVPYTLAVRGVQIGLMFSELADCIKVSFRSKGDIPANELAKKFGGNGHRNAAGARIPGGRLEEVIERVLTESTHFVR